MFWRRYVVNVCYLVRGLGLDTLCMASGGPWRRLVVCPAHKMWDVTKPAAMYHFPSGLLVFTLQCGVHALQVNGRLGSQTDSH